ncbi:hypothetical protein BC567DRAFT_1273 [Phyllosticta citribraziliensis]
MVCFAEILDRAERNSERIHITRFREPTTNLTNNTMPLSATPKKQPWTPTTPPTLSLPPPPLFANFSYAAYITAYNATSHLSSPTPLSSMSAYYADDLAYVSAALPKSGAGASAVGGVDEDEAAEPSMAITPLSTVLQLFGGARAAQLREKLVPRVVTWCPDGRFIMAELDAVFVFGEPHSLHSTHSASEQSQPKGQGGDDEDDKFPTDGGPLHGVELRRGKPVAVRFWATYEMQGGKIKVLRLARWGAGQACAWPED